MTEKDRAEDSWPGLSTGTPSYRYWGNLYWFIMRIVTIGSLGGLAIASSVQRRKGSGP